MTGSERPTPKRAGKNIGAHRFNQVYRQTGARPIAEHEDEELLTILLGSRTAAKSVLVEVGSLAQYSSMGEGRRLMHYPGINKGIALKLDALFECAVRIR
jgi:DNA repair protein RadC